MGWKSEKMARQYIDKSDRMQRDTGRRIWGQSTEDPNSVSRQNSSSEGLDEFVQPSTSRQNLSGLAGFAQRVASQSQATNLTPRPRPSSTITREPQEDMVVNLEPPTIPKTATPRPRPSSTITREPQEDIMVNLEPPNIPKTATNEKKSEEPPQKKARVFNDCEFTVKNKNANYVERKPLKIRELLVPF